VAAEENRIVHANQVARDMFEVGMLARTHGLTAAIDLLW
jgi:hypothetical protein